MAKEVNVELNMTPFIGLFALLVVMLLLTAVWTNIMTLSTNTSSSTASDSSSPPPKNRTSYNVTILKDKLELSKNKKGTYIPHINGEINKQRLTQILKHWKKLDPKRSDLVLNSENTVTYNQLIETFDTLVGNGWPDVGVNTQ